MLYVRRYSSGAVQLSSRRVVSSSNVRHVQACTRPLAPAPAAAREVFPRAPVLPLAQQHRHLHQDHHRQRQADNNNRRNGSDVSTLAGNRRGYLTSRARQHLCRPAYTPVSAWVPVIPNGDNFRGFWERSASSFSTATVGHHIRRGCSTSNNTAAPPGPGPEPASTAEAPSGAAAAAAAAVAFPVVSSVDPAAAKQEAAIAQMAESGEWENALHALQAVRDEGMKPSMEAHINVISVCRRALQWDLSSKVYREMIDAHLVDSESFFERMACDNFKDQSEHVFARACGIVVHMMRANDVQPNYGTYRALLQYCKDEGSWQAAILLLEHSKRSGTQLNLFSYDLLVATVAEQGFREVSTMLYELGVVEADQTAADQQQQALLERDGSGGGAVGWPRWPLRVFAKGALVLELHDLTLSTALATVQVALLDVVRKPPGRAHWSGGVQRFRIITGMGNKSKDNEAVIKPAVAEALESMGLRPEFQQNNEGCIELKSENLEAYAHRVRTQGAAAAAWA